MEYTIKDRLHAFVGYKNVLFYNSCHYDCYLELGKHLNNRLAILKDNTELYWDEVYTGSDKFADSMDLRPNSCCNSIEEMEGLDDYLFYGEVVLVNGLKVFGVYKEIFSDELLNQLKVDFKQLTFGKITFTKNDFTDIDDDRLDNYTRNIEVFK